MAKSIIKNVFNGIILSVNKVLGIFKKNKFGIGFLNQKYLKHLPFGNKIKTIQSKFGKIYLKSGQDLYHSIVEIFDHEIYLQDFKKDSYIIDCGANVGLSTIYFKSICPSANVECFEPDISNFELLKLNIDSCGFSEGVNIYNSAIWIENTTIDFINDGSLSSRISNGIDKSNSNKVEAVRLRDLINKPVNFLKIDIEGAEYNVLKDIEDRLNFVDRMFLEYHGSFQENYQLLEIFTIINRNNFKFYIKEAGIVYVNPFYRFDGEFKKIYDVQLNIFCFRD
jgi:FkbM family methyltransferase